MSNYESPFIGGVGSGNGDSASDSELAAPYYPGAETTPEPPEPQEPLSDEPPPPEAADSVAAEAESGFVESAEEDPLKPLAEIADQTVGESVEEAPEATFEEDLAPRRFELAPEPAPEEEVELILETFESGAATPEALAPASADIETNLEPEPALREAPDPGLEASLAAEAAMQGAGAGAGAEPARDAFFEEEPAPRTFEFAQEPQIDAEPIEERAEVGAESVIEEAAPALSMEAPEADTDGEEFPQFLFGEDDSAGAEQFDGLDAVAGLTADEATPLSSEPAERSDEPIGHRERIRELADALQDESQEEIIARAFAAGYRAAREEREE
ncbi:MAG: hypothetical protein V3S83_04090 [Gemmatimonadota bacterium]